MSVIVINTGSQERDTNGRRTTNLTKSFGDQGTVRVTVEGIEYVFGPGDSRSFADDGLGAKIAAADSRLRVADSREGTWKSNASLSVTRW
jgi:hypothetical protein